MYAKAAADLPSLTSEEEKASIEFVFNEALSQVLSEADRALSPVVNVLPLLRAGIGIHHSGLLPFVKELVELLFQEGLVKVLFATETFAMGLNMPARTAVFTQVTKWDGTEQRWIAAGEYTQMSGRAGRRGQDARGTCIILVDRGCTEEAARTLLLGSTAALNSSFKLTYYTLLNLMRRNDTAAMEATIRRSFHQFQFDQKLPAEEQRLGALEAQAAALDAASDQAVDKYERLRLQLAEAGQTIQAEMLRPERSLAVLRPGRVVRVRVAGADYGWGAVCAVLRASPPAEGAVEAADSYTVDILLRVLLPPAGGGGLLPCPPGAPGTLAVVPVALPCLSAISALMLLLPDDLRSAEARASVGLALEELRRRFPEGPPRLDPVQDMKIDSAELHAALTRVRELEPRLLAHPLFAAEAEALRCGAAAPAAGADAGRLARAHRKAALLEQAGALRARLAESEVSRFRRELRARTAVLRRLGHVSGEGVVSRKGRAACEINAADELLVAELMFEGRLGALSPPQLAALVSCFVPTERCEADAARLRPELASAHAALVETARRVAAVQREAGVPAAESDEEYVESFKPSLMDIVYRWCTGAGFAELLANTTLFEGTVIRAVRRLDELLVQLSDAAQSVGDRALQAQFQAAAMALRHGAAAGCMRARDGVLRLTLSSHARHHVRLLAVHMSYRPTLV